MVYIRIGKFSFVYSPITLYSEKKKPYFYMQTPRNSPNKLNEDVFVDRQMGSKNYKDCRVSSMISCLPFYETVFSHVCLKDTDFVTAILLPPTSPETGGWEILKNCACCKIFMSEIV